MSLYPDGFPIPVDKISRVLSIVYFKGSQVEFSNV